MNPHKGFHAKQGWCNCPPDRTHVWSRGQIHNANCPFHQSDTESG